MFRAGYGENYAHWRVENRIAAIALPIHNQEHLLGCLGLVYIAKAMPIQEAAKRYLPMMRETVDQIETRWRQFEAGDPSALILAP